MRLLDGRSVPPGRLLCCLKKINRAIVSASKRQDERTGGARGTGPNARTLILSRGGCRLRPVLQNPRYREPTARDIGLDAGLCNLLSRVQTWGGGEEGCRISPPLGQTGLLGGWGRDVVARDYWQVRAVVTVSPGPGAH